MSENRWWPMAITALAGMALIFNCAVADVRKATLEEITHGHVHGAHGHHH